MLPLGFILASGFVFGVAIAGQSFAVPVILLLLTCTVIAALLHERRAWLIPIALGMLALTLGIIRVEFEPSTTAIPDSVAESAVIVGNVASVPRRYPDMTITLIDVIEPEPARVSVRLEPYPAIKEGDVVRIHGAYLPNQEPRGFFAREGAQGNVLGESHFVIENDATPAVEFRNFVSNEVRSRVQSRLPEPASAFTVGMLLGDDGAMTEATRNAFRVGGMTHLTAVSGLHVGIIAGGILLLSRSGLVHRWVLLGASIPLIWTFAWVVGMRPSVVRASLMLTLFLIAQLLGRPRDTINAVAVAAALMILVNPSIRHDIGFQLSVAATFGIAIGLPLVVGRSYWHVGWMVPLAAEIAVTPLILYHFSYFTLVSPLANIIAAPFVVVAMPLAILMVGVSVLNSGIADLIAYLVWLPSRAIVFIADTAAIIPLVSGDIEPISLTAVWIYYLLIAGLIAILYLIIHPAFSDPDGDFGTVYRI